MKKDSKKTCFFVFIFMTLLFVITSCSAKEKDNLTENNEQLSSTIHEYTEKSTIVETTYEQMTDAAEESTETTSEETTETSYYGEETTVKRKITNKSKNNIKYKIETEKLSNYGNCRYDKIKLIGFQTGIPAINISLNKRFNEFTDCYLDEYNEMAIEYSKEKTLSDIVDDFALTCEFKNIWSSNKYVSIQLEESYFAGGFHINYNTFGLTYNLITGKKINLSDVPVKNKNSDIKKVLIKYINKHFAEMAVKYYEADFTYSLNNAIDEVNNRIDEIEYYIDDYGFNLYFNNYQIACYAAGPTQIIIPISEFDLK